MKWNFPSCIAVAACTTLVWSIAPAHPLTLNDLLTAGNVGDVDIDTAGRRLAFEYMPSYERQTNFGLVDAVGFEKTGALYLYDFSSGVAPRPLVTRGGESNPILETAPGLDPGKLDGMWSGGFSPRGTRLLVFWREGSTVRAGAFDFATQRLQSFTFTPDFPLNTIAWSYATHVWLSEDELIFSTRSEGTQLVQSLRYAPAQGIMRQWQDAWRGDKPTVTISRSTANEPDRALQEGTLVRVDARSGAVHALATGRYLCLVLSPDGQRLAALRVGMPRQAQPDAPVRRSSIDMYRMEAMLFDLRKADAPIELSRGMEVASNSLVFSAKGDRLSFFAWRDGAAMETGSFQLFDVKHNTRQTVAPIGLDLVAQRPSWIGFPQNAIPFGRGLAVPARAQADAKAPRTFSAWGVNKGRIDWHLALPDGTSRNLTAHLENVSPTLVHASSNGLLVLAKDGIWRIPAAGRGTKLTAGIGGTFSNPQRIGRFVVAQVGGSVAPGFVAIDVATGEAKAFAMGADLGGDWHPSTELAGFTEQGRILAFSPETQTAIFRVNGYRPWTLKAIAAGGAERQIWTWNAHFASVTAPRAVTLDFKYSDGKPMQAVAVLPEDWTSGRRAPAIVSVYPGGPYSPPKPNAKARRAQLDQGSVIPGWPMELFSGMGYIVLYPNVPRDMMRSEDGNPLGNWGKLVMAAVDALVEQGYADPERIGLYGASQGSWSALSVVTQTTRLKAAVAAFGLADFISHYGSGGIMRYYPDDLENPGNPRVYRYESDRGYPPIGAAPWDDPLTYIKASPLFSARKIQTPLLLIHTDLDIAGFPMEQFDEMFAALSRLRKEAVYLRYWGEGHGVSSPANIRDQWSRIFAWYDKYLDVRRDVGGRIAYDASTLRSRHGDAAWEPERYLQLEGWGR